jgi:hypothetical protein
VKVVELSGPKKREYQKDEINELERKSKKRNSRELYRSIN